MISHSGVNQTIALLEKLRETVAEFTGREETLNRDFAAKTAAEQQRRDKALGQMSSSYAEATSQAEIALQKDKDITEAKFKARKARILRAHKNSHQQALKGIEDREGRRKHRLQTETMQMHRNHETGLAEADKARVDFQNSLNQEQDFLLSLEQDAQKKFKGYGKFRRFVSHPDALPEGDLSHDEYQLIAELDALLTKTRDDLNRFGKLLLPALFRHRVPLAILTLCLVPAALVLPSVGVDSITVRDAGIAVGAVLAVGLILHFVGRQQAEPLAKTIADALNQGRRLHDVCRAKCESRHAREHERVETEFKNKKEWIEQEWALTLEEATQAKADAPATVEAKFARSLSTNERQHSAQLAGLETRHSRMMEELTLRMEEQKSAQNKIAEDKEANFKSEFEAQRHVLETDWQARITPLLATVKELQTAAKTRFPEWTDFSLDEWKAPTQFAPSAQFAQLQVNLEKLAGGLPKSEQLALAGPNEFSLPLLLTYPGQGSLLIETRETGRTEAVATLNNVMLRLLSTAAPGKLSFTVIDPIGLGQNFSGITHLADYAEHLINGRIWTQSGQIEERLAELNEHMEKVIQMYLRNEYATIAEYNQQAGNIAEKYHYLVIANFPANFTDVAAKRLLSIATSGARCGVYTLIHWDHTQPEPPQFIPDELRNNSVTIVAKGNKFLIPEKNYTGTTLLLEPSPQSDLVTDFIHKVGQSNRDANRVEVPFSHVTPADAELWTVETTTELRVPIGRTGATKFQYLAIGKGTRQHALIAGKTGSGKSTLFHVIITNLALWCHPNEVEFYLIDFKKGVEFKCYAEKRLPHARVVAIESDREFGLSVLQRIDQELKRRGDLFRDLGVQDLAGYKKAGGTEPMPRTLLIIDEFQEFFVEDDKIAQNASVLLDRIVRQGRAFGIHVLLGSQTLGGAYTMARTTMGQMVIRIALQCNEADAYLIMDDNNPAPRLLSRPGEGIYNDQAGNVLGNSPFQAVWLADDVRDEYLEKVRERANQSDTTFPGPIVFEGDAPADIRENAMLQTQLQAQTPAATSVSRIWLGAPNSIKGPTEAAFRKQSGNNLLIVGQRDEAILSILSIALISLVSQHPARRCRILVLDGNAPDSTQHEYLERVAGFLPHSVSLVKHSEIGETIRGLTEEMKRRKETGSSETGPVTFLFIHGLQRFSKLRYEDDFSFSSDPETEASPAVQLNQLVSEGPGVGIHVIATCDTYNNVNRFLSKKAFSEFEMRVLFQMSANDSASLIDNPRAGSLGLHRALFYNEQEGYLELFRPYALPRQEWLEESAKYLSRLNAG